jgi:hypothetical protein
VSAKTFEMADALVNPDHFDWPKCVTCGRAMRLVGIEPGYRSDHASVHTYECICGVVAIDEVSNN